MLVSGCEASHTWTTPGSGGLNTKPIPLGPSFKSIDQNILQKKCVGCHSAGRPGQRVALDWDSLLHSPYDLIDLEAPEESGLYIAVTRGDNKRMPPAKEGFPMLPEEQVATILEWIQNGAKD